MVYENVIKKRENDPLTLKICYFDIRKLLEDDC